MKPTETCEIQIKTNTIDFHEIPDHTLRLQDLNNMYEGPVCHFCPWLSTLEDRGHSTHLIQIDKSKTPNEFP